MSFSFGAPGQTSGTTPFSFSQPQQTTAGFTFGATTQAPGFSFGTTTANAPPTFSFGGTTSTVVTTSINTLPVTSFAQPSGFGFSNPTVPATTANLFGSVKPAPPIATVPSTVIPGNIGFGGGTAFGSTPSTGFGFGQTTTSSAPSAGFGFGQTMAPSSSAPSAGFGFGQTMAPTSTAPSAGFGFGQTTASSSAPLPTFGANISTVAPLGSGGFSMSIPPTTSTGMTSFVTTTISTPSTASALSITSGTPATTLASLGIATTSTVSTFSTPLTVQQPPKSISVPLTSTGTTLTSVPIATTGFAFNVQPTATTVTTSLSFGTTTTPSFTTVSTTSSITPVTTTSETSQQSSKSTTFSQLEEAINKWNVELEEQERIFLSQATQVNAWDRLLVSNAEKITTLNESVERVKLEQQRLDHELDFIVAQQKELEELIEPLERSVEASPSLSIQQHADVEREHTYHLAESVDGQLKRMSEDIKKIIEHLNTTSHEDENEPMQQISKILNAHMDALQWIDQNTGLIQKKMDEVTKVLESTRKEKGFRIAYK